MATFFTLQFGALNPVSLSGYAINKNDSNLYIRITGVDGYKLAPLTTIKAVVAPDEYAWNDNDALEYLESTAPSDPSLGIYVSECQNNTDVDIDISFRDILIRPINRQYPFENTKYNLYWLISLGTSSIQGSASGFYTFPHNIQPYEVKISGGLTSTNVMRYNIKWNNIAHEDYPAYSNYFQPYNINCYDFYSEEDIIPWSGIEAGIMPDIGYSFEVPFYQSGTLSPGLYTIAILNRGINGDSDIKSIELNHSNFIDSTNNYYFSNLDEVVFSSVNRDGIKKVGEFPIDKDIIDRRRLSIGINDFAIKDNLFVKQGTYVSPYYPLDGNLYTLSLNVDELIPSYPNINSYDIIKYFIEVNSNWEPISPINREDEFDIEQNIIPKIFVFDRGTNKNSHVKYIESGLVKIIRVKIVFDLSQISGEKFIPPEVRDYKCIIYDKDQLNEF